MLQKELGQPKSLGGSKDFFAMKCMKMKYSRISTYLDYSGNIRVNFFCNSFLERSHSGIKKRIKENKKRVQEVKNAFDRYLPLLPIRLISSKNEEVSVDLAGKPGVSCTKLNEVKRIDPLLGLFDYF